MINHLSLRLAWHNDGWNGHICANPKSNTYCVGSHSYPGDVISTERDLDWESDEKVAGCHCSKIGGIPPCAYSINAFGTESIKAKADPPAFFRDNTESKVFELKPATACIWPYEQMYSDDVKFPEGHGRTYDYDKRLKAAKEFFNSLTPDKSLIFYYANRSNPFSEEDNPVFALVGISVMKSKDDFLFYNNVSQKNKEIFAGGFIWQLPITSHYPEFGFRIPYHKYLDNPEVLNKIAFIPENQNNFKFAAKRISDDDALIYVERLIEVVGYLISINDDTENWQVRKSWLQDLLSELWKSRGAYPGLPSIFQYLEQGDLISEYYKAAAVGKSKEFAERILAFLNDRNAAVPSGGKLSADTLEAARRAWMVKLSKGKELASKVLSRIHLTVEQVKNILSPERIKNSIYATLTEMVQNPYLLSEQYVGDDYNDEITFTKIDHGVLPLPDLGLEHLMSKGDWRRLRGLLMDELHYESTHSFVSQNSLLEKINERLSHYPEWKKEIFNEEFIEYDKEKFEQAIVFKEQEGKVYCYDKHVYEDEQIVSGCMREMLDRGEHRLLKPFPEEKWKDELFNEDSDLAKKNRKAYSDAIQGQIEVCQRIFNKPLCVLSGSAGTGKTYIIKSLIKAIKHSFGKDESFCLLAPTGKAADRIRQKTQTNADTIHSFLMRNGWLNENFTYKRYGGTENSEYTTIIIDECSMIDLGLMAALFRAVNWNVLRRIIFVGDPNQLPPIGRGKVFADIIQYIKEVNPESYGKLLNNIRQMENKIDNKGTGIIDLAQLYISDNIRWNENSSLKADAEQFLKRIQEGEEELDKDLRVITWKDTDELEEKLRELIDADMAMDKDADIMDYQIISPYRNELFGIEHLNGIMQEHLNAENIEAYGTFGGLAVRDKIIQQVNRANSTAYYGYDMQKKSKLRLNVYNGELGTVFYSNRQERKLSVEFERKSQIRVGFKGESEIEENIDLAYAISVHKAQGSEFKRVYLVLPKHKTALLSTELLYTGITRASNHLTILVEEDYRPFFSMRRPEKSKLAFINSSLFTFRPINDSMLSFSSWYEEGKIHSTLTEFMVRSKSEVIIANMLAKEIGENNFVYEEPLIAEDGTIYLPDFTIRFRGKTYYWEHLGLMNIERYKRHWEEKEQWYNKHFPGQLLVTYEGGTISIEAVKIINDLKSD